MPTRIAIITGSILAFCILILVIVQGIKTQEKLYEATVENGQALQGIQSTLVHEPVESSSSSSSFSSSYPDSEQFCQDCADYYATHKAARDEYTACDNHVYFSTVMATVCQFHMGDYMCPPSENTNPYCIGPMYFPFQKIHHE